MRSLTITLRPLSAFGGPLMGDTLFGQLCWALRRRAGRERLAELLEGYTAGRPFAVLSDAFPAGRLPRPALPLSFYRPVEDAERKQLKRRSWLAVDDFARPMAEWLACCKTAKELAGEALGAVRPHPHNSINRLTGTTGTGEFAPYTQERLWMAGAGHLEVYVCHDEARIDRRELEEALSDVGIAGYGRDASIGLGKFEIVEVSDDPWPAQDNANAWFTLAPCAPQGLALVPGRCFYHPFTRFGRHGDIGVHLGNPFKTPVLMAATGAILSPREFSRATFTGRGLGGDGSLSKTIPETVHQGYSPVLPVNLAEKRSQP